MGAESSKSNSGGNIPGVARHKIVARWQKRTFSTQLFAVARHDERADGMFVALQQGDTRWTSTDDATKWPLDPPLSDGGVQGARETGRRVCELAKTSDCQIHVVISSPYYRCVQTAVEFCRQLGTKTKLLIDQSVGEIYGPTVMGAARPPNPVRPIDQIQAYCLMQGVSLHPEVIGKWPEWPETVQDARRRFASRFLTYLHRSALTRRNFLLVSHADFVAVSLSLMPSQSGHAVEAVDFGGLFLARRERRELVNAGGSRNSTSRKSKGVVTVTPVTPVDCWADSSRNDNDPLAILPEAETQEPEASYDCSQDAKSTASESGRVRRNSTSSWSLRSRSSSKASVSSNPGSRGKEDVLKLPDASDDWHVFTHGINLRKKPSVRGDKFIKKVVSLTKGSRFGKDHIEKLLTELSTMPLGDSHSDHHSSRSSQVSFSTVVFGASQDGSIIGSDAESRYTGRRGTGTSSRRVDGSVISTGGFSTVSSHHSGGMRDVEGQSSDLYTRAQERAEERRISQLSQGSGSAATKSGESSHGSLPDMHHSHSDLYKSGDSPRSQDDSSDNTERSSSLGSTSHQILSQYERVPRRGRTCPPTVLQQHKPSIRSPRPSATFSSQSVASQDPCNPSADIDPSKWSIGNSSLMKARDRRSSAPSQSMQRSASLVLPHVKDPQSPGSCNASPRGSPSPPEPQKQFSMSNSSLMKRRLKGKSDEPPADVALALPSGLLKEATAPKPHQALVALQEALQEATKQKVASPEE